MLSGLFAKNINLKIFHTMPIAVISVIYDLNWVGEQYYFGNQDGN